MNTVEYWDNAAKDPQVDIKYISDVDTELCLKDLGKLDGNVLEIGCGVGRLMSPGFWGVDVSVNMLEIANKRKPECGFKHTTSGILPFEDKSFDTVYSYLLFQHLKVSEILSYIKESYRVLKTKGVLKFQFIVGDESEPLSNHYQQQRIESILNSCGFDFVSFRSSVAHELWTICEARKSKHA